MQNIQVMYGTQLSLPDFVSDICASGCNNAYVSLPFLHGKHDVTVAELALVDCEKRF